MKKFKKLLKQIILSVIGFPIVIIGLILIPLPGPGILITFLGLFILSFAFESAKKQLDQYKIKLKKIYSKAKQKEDDFLSKLDKK